MGLTSGCPASAVLDPPARTGNRPGDVSRTAFAPPRPAAVDAPGGAPVGRLHLDNPDPADGRGHILSKPSAPGHARIRRSANFQPSGVRW